MKGLPGINNVHALLIAALFMLSSCEKEFLYEEPPPDVSAQTSTLEAVLTTTPPNTINASYWKTADYLRVTAADVSTQNLYTDGYMNVTNLFSGLGSFSVKNGTGPGLTLKAAYDAANLYILAEWTDSTMNAQQYSWLFNGPADPNKGDSPTGWTSQRNADKLAFAFEISAASGPAGTFTNKGCAASCHSSGSNYIMQPTSGKVDIWNWSMATSNPLGYVHDMYADGSLFDYDGGQKMFERNSPGTISRSGPAFEWNGVDQDVTLPTGQSATLDPGFYLMNKTAFTGSPHNGDSIFHKSTPPGDCVSCHGPSGEGGILAGAINHLSNNKKTRTELISEMDMVPDMAAYWGPLNAQDRDDIIAYLRGLSGVPGYFLEAPTGSNADITAISNVTPPQVLDALLPSSDDHTKYQVLIIRKLNTGNSDDAQFNPALVKTYRFGVALMDNDGANHAGSNVETLTFK